MSVAHLGKKYKPMSEQGRKNLSLAQVGNPNNPQRKWKGKTATERFGEQKARVWRDKIAKTKKLQMTEQMREKLREIRLKCIYPKRDTFLEKEAQAVVALKGLGYVTHKAMLGQPDIFIEPNVCIFLDGCYWHGCPECFGWNNKKTDHFYRDFRIKQTLELEGYKVIRIWEHDIARFGQILDKVMEWTTTR